MNEESSAPATNAVDPKRVKGKKAARAQVDPRLTEGEAQFARTRKRLQEVRKKGRNLSEVKAEVAEAENVLEEAERYSKEAKGSVQQSSPNAECQSAQDPTQLAKAIIADLAKTAHDSLPKKVSVGSASEADLDSAVRSALTHQMVEDFKTHIDALGKDKAGAVFGGDQKALIYLEDYMKDPQEQVFLRSALVHQAVCVCRTNALPLIGKLCAVPAVLHVGKMSYAMCSEEAKLELERRQAGDFSTDTYYSNVTFETDKVTCIGGESGSGKTSNLLLMAQFVIYLRAADLQLQFSDEASKESRNAAVVEALRNYMKTIFDSNDAGGLREELGWTTEELTIGLAIDEAGGHNELTRALCSTVGGSLRGGLGISESVTLCVGVAGTGVGSETLAVGSANSTYNLVRLTCSSLWAKFCKDRGVNKSLVRKVDNHPWGKLAVQNPRFARVLCSIVKGVPKGLFAEFNDTMVDSMLIQAAARFRRLNGLESLKPMELYQFIGAVAEVVLYHNNHIQQGGGTILSTSGSWSGLTRSILMIKYGVLVDYSRWSHEGPSAGEVSWSTETANEGTTKYLVAPENRRYQVSTAQSAILLLLLNLGPQKSSLGGESLERATASLLALTVTAHRKRPLSSMLSALGATQHKTPKASRKKPRKKLNVIIDGGKRVEVELFHEHHSGLVPGGSLDMALQGKFDRTLIVINGPKAAFADAVVAIPNTAILLVQCKDYKANRTLSEAAVLHELHKMGHPNGTYNAAHEAGKKKSDEEALAAQRVRQSYVEGLKTAWKAKEVHYLIVTSHPSSLPSKIHLPSYVSMFALSGIPDALRQMLPFDAVKASGSSILSEGTYEKKIDQDGSYKN